MHEDEKSKVDRRTFVGQSAGMVVGGLGCVGSLEGLRAALAMAMTPQKPLLTETSLNAFLAETRSPRARQLIAKEASADLRGFLAKNFEVDRECQRLLTGLSTEDTAKINQALQEGLAGQNALQVQLANVDLQNVAKPRIGVVRSTRAVDRAATPTVQITTITIGP
jgi:hypothetical protein